MPRMHFGLVLATSIALASGAQAADIRLLSSWDKTNPAVGVLAEPFAKGVEAATKGNIKFIVSGPGDRSAVRAASACHDRRIPDAVHARDLSLRHDRSRGRPGCSARRPRSAPEVRHDRSAGQALSEAWPQGGRRRDLGNQGLSHRAARAGRALGRSARPQDPRHAELPHRHRHAGRVAGRAAGRRGLCRIGEGRGGRRGMARRPACSACAGTRSPNTCCVRASGSAITCS